MLNRWNTCLSPTVTVQTWIVAAMISLLVARTSPGHAATAARKPRTHAGSVWYQEDASGPKARLRNGKEYRLQPLSEAEKQRVTEKAKRARERKAHVQSTLATPARVDHRQFHGPIRDQAERGTCASFAAAAALEGIYRRADASRFRSLDLSEQYINHVQKMVERSPTSRAGLMEDELGCWAGSQIHYISAVIYQYGTPEEAVLAYNPTEAFEKTGSNLQDEDGHARSDAPQLSADDFNLDRNNLPDSALEKATYRPGKVYWLSDQEMSDSNRVEQVVAAGYDIMFGLVLVDDERTDDGAWIPIDGGQIRGGHAMLIVGYDRPDRYYIVRNQWGPDPDANDGGYSHISYDYLEQYAGDGAVLAEPVEPVSRTTDHNWIAWWSFGDDGHMDIYRLPGTYSRKDPRAHDHRVGTWFDADGTAYRMNGTFKDGDLVVYINYDKPNLPPDELSGDWYRYQLTADGQSIHEVDSGTEGQPVSGTAPSNPSDDTGVCGTCPGPQ
jgi:C1A family cysteine protease